MADFLGLMKQAQKLQERMQEMQNELADTEVEGTSGGGLVKVVLTGKGMMARVSLDPSLTGSDDAQILEDLIVAAHNDAKARLDTTLADKMKQITGGMPLPPGFGPGL